MKAPGAMSPRVLSWLAATFVSGATVMALEMVAVRLFAPYFGYSVYVWGTTIGVVMTAMVAGYAGDHSPMKAGDVKQAMKTIWEIYSEFTTWIDPQEETDEEDEGEEGGE